MLQYTQQQSPPLPYIILYVSASSRNEILGTLMEKSYFDDFEQYVHRINPW